MTAHAQMPHFICGHAKSPDNLSPNGNRVRCLICTKLNRQDRVHGPKYSFRQPSAEPYPHGHPAISVYEAEKAKRATKPNPQMIEARRQLAALDALAVVQQRGGRPRKSA